MSSSASGGVKTYNKNDTSAEASEFNYGDTIVVKVTITATGTEVSTQSLSLLDFSTFASGTAAVFDADDTQVSDAVEVISGKEITLTVETTDLDAGENTLTLKYYGDGNMAAYSETFKVTVTATASDAFEISTVGGAYTYEDGVLEITDGGTYTISMADGKETTTDTISVDTSNGNVTIYLDGVSIESGDTPALEVTGGGSVTLILVGENTLSADDKGTAGVTVTSGTLTIGGTGGLTTDGIEGEQGSITIIGGSYSDSSIVADLIAEDYSSHTDSTSSPYDCVVASDTQELIVTGGVDYTYDEASGTITITGGGEYTVSMNDNTETATETTIVVKSDEDVTITLVGVSIESGGASPIEIDCEGDVTIILSGENTLIATGDGDAGLQKTSENNTLTITCEIDDETDSLTATGGEGAAGIGGGSGGNGTNITIEGGTVTATGGEGAAGIGGGLGGNGTNITIEGGDVAANAGITGGTDDASAVGGGSGGESSDISISCGTYNTDVSEYTADNYYSVDVGNDGSYTIFRSSSTVYGTAETLTHSVTLDGLYSNLTKNEIDHSTVASYKVVLDDLSADDAAAFAALSSGAELSFAADISIVKYDESGNEVAFDYNQYMKDNGIEQKVSVKFPVPVEEDSIKVYHFDSTISGGYEEINTNVSVSDDGYTVTFAASSFSGYGLTGSGTNLNAEDYAANVNFTLEKTASSLGGEYTLKLCGINESGDAVIRQFYSAKLKFAFDGGTEYDITNIDALKITPQTGINMINAGNGEYVFYVDATVETYDYITAQTVTLGTVTVNGLGAYKLGLDDGYTNMVTCTDNSEGIASSFVYDENSTAASGNLYLVGIPAADNTNVTMSNLTVNVMFPNEIAETGTEYTAMSVAYSNFRGSGIVKLGNDSETSMSYGTINAEANADGKWNGYSFTVSVPKDYATNLVFSGDGYRTYRVTIVPTEGSASVTVWNNVLDAKTVVTTNDADQTTAESTFLAGDIVGSGKINLYDLSAVMSYFGNSVQSYNKYTRYDLNRDGVIDSKDIAMVLVSWGK